MQHVWLKLNFSLISLIWSHNHFTGRINYNAINSFQDSYVYPDYQNTSCVSDDEDIYQNTSMMALNESHTSQASLHNASPKPPARPIPASPARQKINYPPAPPNYNLPRTLLHQTSEYMDMDGAEEQRGDYIEIGDDEGNDYDEVATGNDDNDDYDEVPIVKSRYVEHLFWVNVKIKANKAFYC